LNSVQLICKHIHVRGLSLDRQNF